MDPGEAWLLQHGLQEGLAEWSRTQPGKRMPFLKPSQEQFSATRETERGVPSYEADKEQ